MPIGIEIENMKEFRDAIKRWGSLSSQKTKLAVAHGAKEWMYAAMQHPQIPKFDEALFNSSMVRWALIGWNFSNYLYGHYWRHHTSGSNYRWRKENREIIEMYGWKKGDTNGLTWYRDNIFTRRGLKIGYVKAFFVNAYVTCKKIYEALKLYGTDGKMQVQPIRGLFNASYWKGIRDSLIIDLTIYYRYKSNLTQAGKPHNTSEIDRSFSKILNDAMKQAADSMNSYWKAQVDFRDEEMWI